MGNNSNATMSSNSAVSGVSPLETNSDVKYGTVLGGGAFGTAMAQVLARNGVKVTMWVLEKEVKDSINQNHLNSVFLKDIPLHENITATNDFAESMKGAQIIMIVIPTPFLRDVVCTRHTAIPVGVPLVCCTKGIENETLLTPFEILTEELPGKYHDYLAAVSGPSFAKEVAIGMPTSVLCASNTPEVGEIIQHTMSDIDFRVYTGTDVIGAEICGAVKNIIAIACGASAGLGFGHDTMALLITRGLGEITKLAIMKGAHPSTMSGLAGIGDLVLTCTSTMSRNYTVGTRIAKGEKLNEIISSMKMVAEGVKTSKSVHMMCQELGLHLPLCEEVYRVLHEDKDLSQALIDLGQLPLEQEFNPYEHYQEIKTMKLNAVNSRL
mmetsp:Transcript_927/g.1164  ORF Transcript_927/g.1164 Transcript_927/m.1164 type:complete len:381 (+) Transcript_927:119-1261(+)